VQKRHHLALQLFQVYTLRSHDGLCKLRLGLPQADLRPIRRQAAAEGFVLLLKRSCTRGSLGSAGNYLLAL